MREALLSVCGLEHSETIRVAEASVQPAPNHEVGKHKDLIASKLGFVFWLVCTQLPIHTLVSHIF